MTENTYISAVERNASRLFLLAFSYTQNRCDAEDIMQNSFLKLWNFSKAFEDDEHIDKWLTRVCVNECKDSFKSFFRKNSVALEEAEAIASYDKTFNIDLFKAISSLSKKERTVVHLFYYEDMTTKEISALLEIKESTIKSVLRRSREKINRELGDEWIYE